MKNGRKILNKKDSHTTIPTAPAHPAIIAYEDGDTSASISIKISSSHTGSGPHSPKTSLSSAFIDINESIVFVNNEREDVILRIVLLHFLAFRTAVWLEMHPTE